MIEGNSPAEFKLAEASHELAQFEYELGSLMDRVRQLRERIDNDAT